MKLSKTLLTLFALTPASVLAATAGDGTLFEFNHLQHQLGGGMNGKKETSNFKGIYHSYEDGSYGGITFNTRSPKSLDNFGNGAVFHYGLSVTENSEDYNWQFDTYLTASYEAALSSNTHANLGLSFSVNGQVSRIFYNDNDRNVASAYSIGPVVGIRHQMPIDRGSSLTPFAHYFYSSQSVSSSSLWNIFGDAFTDPEKDRSVHDYRDVFVVGMTADLNKFLITPVYIKNDSKESWHISLGVSY